MKYKLAASESEPTAATLRSTFSDLLPPLPEAIYQQELDKAMKPLPNGNVSLEDFKACALGNNDWRNAGPLTVLEVIYIDVLVNYYTRGRSILEDEDYKDLKQYLYGQGSSLPQMSKDEAKFITAVYRFHRGDVIMEEPIYAALKKKLEHTQMARLAEKGLGKTGKQASEDYLAWMEGQNNPQAQ